MEQITYILLRWISSRWSKMTAKRVGSMIRPPLLPYVNELGF